MLKAIRVAVSYSDFAELVDFAYWWRFIWKGLRLQPVQQACFEVFDNRMKITILSVKCYTKIQW